MTTLTPDDAPPPSEGPQIRVLAQYVKDLSFENPMAAAAARAYDSQPLIDMGVEVKSRPASTESDVFEVDLRIKVDAKRGDEILFIIDLVYGGLFQFANVRPEDVEPLLWIECPRLLFPFSRQVLAEITREGGYPPLLVNPIDFTPLYYAEMRAREEAAGGQPKATAAGGSPPASP
ncbi:MAG: protein-export chaperone SecB [Hyphomonadaceae bacterium]|nr:protein-export chaperone SecB [Hyphomonadaceae bacterium]